jgi:ribosomal protein S1
MMDKQNWENVKSKYKIGQIVQGKVVRHMPFGVFLDIGEQGVLGLVRIVDFLDEGGMNEEQFPVIGTNISGVVYEYSQQEDAQINLSAKPSDLQQALGSIEEAGIDN